jgi:hypothetical protein
MSTKAITENPKNILFIASPSQVLSDEVVLASSEFVACSFFHVLTADRSKLSTVI